MYANIKSITITTIRRTNTVFSEISMHLKRESKAIVSKITIPKEIVVRYIFRSEDNTLIEVSCFDASTKSLYDASSGQEGIFLINPSTIRAPIRLIANPIK